MKRDRGRVIKAIAFLAIGGVVLLAATVSRSSEPPASAPSTRPVLMPRNDLPGLKNFAQVSLGLYRGEQPTAEGFAELKKMGIKTVVDLRALHDDGDLLKGTGLRYLRLPCNAWHPEEEDVIRFLKLMEDPANRPVFVHCHYGSDRTGMMVTSYRIVEQGWSIDEATAELPNFGFHPVWQDITDYLKKFDRDEVKKKLKIAVPPTVEVER